MTVTIYTYTDDIMRLDKTDFLSQVAQKTGTVVEPVSVEAPDILLDGTVTSGNYLYIDTFGCYYWITGKIVERNGITRIKTKRDPAMSFLSGILGSDCICSRNTKKYNSDFPDQRYTVLQNKYIESFVMYPLSNDDCIIFAYVE